MEQKKNLEKEEKLIKIKVVGPADYYARFIENHELVDDIKEADVVLFTGGEDVDPIMYGVTDIHPNTFSNISRDKEELEVFKSIRPDQLALGICRGSQFLCVANGGKLIQDCYGHAIGSTHEITNGVMCYQITSTHHQMQYPFNLDPEDYSILYYARCGSDFSDYGDLKLKHLLENGEPEIVLYKKEGYPKCLAIQGHPEMIPNSPVAKMINNLIKTYLECI